MRNIKDLTGLTYGRLTVLSHDGFASNRSAKWLCECSCGKMTTVIGYHLRIGHTVSCGCYGAERTITRQTKHSEGETPIYGVWRQMRQRCRSPKHPCYSDYGERGIDVCESWNDFSEFKAWALSVGYAPGLELDRINNDSGYSPSNCRWATRKEQCRNTRRTWKYNGRPVIEICEDMGLNYNTIASRYFTLGWPTDRALFTPIKARSKHEEQNRV